MSAKTNEAFFNEINPLRDLCGSIKGHSSVTNQLERSATSVGANIHEANYAQSKADFVEKFQIAFKECYETEYWLEFFVKAE